MDKQMLKCDICGGTLKMQSNHEAICENCGMAYSIESLREKFNGLKVSVTGSNEDVAQWRVLLQTYLANCDYSAAESVVKKILEAIPNDRAALETYTNLQEWKHYDIRNGLLFKYEGASHTLIIPTGIREIRQESFGDNRNSIERIVFPDGLKVIGEWTFVRCKLLSSIVLPKGVTIKEGAFMQTALKRVDIPEGAIVEKNAFFGCNQLSRVNVRSGSANSKVSEFAFDECRNLSTIDYQMPNGLKMAQNPKHSLDEQKKEEGLRLQSLQNDRKLKGKCQHCGGEFKGLWSKRCSYCGRLKDY